MINDKHWESDVFAGAGLGIFSVHLGLALARYRWGYWSPGTAASWHVAPLYYARDTGLTLSWQPR